MEYSPIALALLNQATDTRLPRDKPGLGATLSDMMLQQAKQQSTQADADAKRYALNEERRTQEMLKGMDLSDPAAVEKLYRIDPALGIKLMQQQRMQQQQKIMQDVLTGGGGSDANKLAELGAMSGNPQLMQLAQFKQAQENRAIDEQNRIAAEERQTQKEQEKSTKQASIPGYDILPDVVIDPATARASRELNSAIPTYENAIKKIEKLIDKHGSTVGVGTDTNEVEQAMADLMNAERAVNNTGVLNVGEIPVLQQLYSTFDPRNPMNLGKSKEEMKAAALSYLADRKGLIQGKLKSIGYIPKEVSGNKDSAPASLESDPLGIR